MSEHTKGPWEVEFDEDDCEIRLCMGSRIGHPERYIAIHGVIIADLISEDDCEFKEAMANARLMAAAPDMLEALEAVEWADGMCCPYCEQISEDGHADDCLIGNALKKARGEG